jgi:hypothetical protein
MSKVVFVLLVTLIALFELTPTILAFADGGG